MEASVERPPTRKERNSEKQHTDRTAFGHRPEGDETDPLLLAKSHNGVSWCSGALRKERLELRVRRVRSVFGSVKSEREYRSENNMCDVRKKASVEVVVFVFAFFFFVRRRDCQC